MMNIRGIFLVPLLSLGCSAANGSDEIQYTDQVKSQFSINIESPQIVQTEIKGKIPECGEIKAAPPKILVDFEQPSRGGMIYANTRQCSGAIPNSRTGRWSYGTDFDLLQREEILVAYSVDDGDFDCEIEWELSESDGQVGFISEWILEWKIPCDRKVAINKK